MGGLPSAASCGMLAVLGQSPSSEISGALWSERSGPPVLMCSPGWACPSVQVDGGTPPRPGSFLCHCEFPPVLNLPDGLLRCDGSSGRVAWTWVRGGRTLAFPLLRVDVTCRGHEDGVHGQATLG